MPWMAMRTRPLAICRALMHRGFETPRIELWNTIGGLPGEMLQDDAVDDGFDGVVLALLEAHALGELGHLAVDAGAEALLVEGFELFAEFALAAAHDRGVDGDALAGARETIRSTIWSAVCREMGLPQLGQ